MHPGGPMGPPGSIGTIMRHPDGLGNKPVNNIIYELTGKFILEQDKDIEIERLSTTCQALNNKIAKTMDLEQDIDVLNNRLTDSEMVRA